MSISFFTYLITIQICKCQVTLQHAIYIYILACVRAEVYVCNIFQKQYTINVNAFAICMQVWFRQENGIRQTIKHTIEIST